MAHDVFISYASEDKAVADKVCEGLEKGGVRCWIAPRDVPVSGSYPEAISAAIQDSRAMVLVFSTSASDSPQVMREVERAVSKGIPIICFRIENVEPSEPMEFFISARRQWLDALTPPLEQHLPQLTEAVLGLLGMPQPARSRDPLRAGMEQRLADLVEEHEAIVRQLGYEINAADGIKLRRQLSAIQGEIARVEQSLKEPRTTPTGQRIETNVQGRVLDAALPRRVTVGRPTELVAQVRLITSDGLKAILRVDRGYQVRGKDVVSRCFEVEFPVTGEDQLGARVLTLKVDAPDFAMSSHTKKLQIPPDGDSQVVRFLLTPCRAGKLEVYLEVYKEDVVATSQAFFAESQAAAVQPAAGSASYVIVSLPLITYSWLQPSGSGIPSREAPSVTGPLPPPARSMPARRALPLLAIVSLLCVVTAISGGLAFQNVMRARPLPSPLPFLTPTTSEPTQGPSAAASSGDLRIAVLAPLSGPVPTFGASTRDGALLAINEWNAKCGVNGRKIVPIVEDSQCMPDPAVNAANKVIEQDKVDFIVGEVCSRASIPVSEIANAEKVIQISPSSTNPRVTLSEDGRVKDYIFRAGFINPFQGRVGAKFARDNLKVQNAFIMFDPADDYSRGLAEEFENAFTAAGGKVVGKETYSASDTDFSAILAKIAAAKPDVVYLPDYYNIVNLVTRQAKQKGIATTFLGGDVWDSEDLDLKAAAGGYFTNHYAPDSTAPEVVAFEKAYGAAYEGAVPDTLAALAYDATNLLLTAIQNAGTVDTDKVRAAMEGISFQGVTGRITFDKQHNPVKSAAILKVTEDGIVFDSVVAP